MTTTELKKKIAESQNQAWFKSQTLSFNFSYINFNIELAGLSAIYEFIINQLNQWEKKSKELPKELKGSFEYFKNAKDQVSDFISRNVNKDKIILNGQWTNLQRDITNTVKVNYPFVYESPYTSFLIDINTKLPKSFSSAFNFIIGKIEYKNNDKDSYIGTLLAYEFDLKDHTKLTERRHAEKLSMNLIRNNFQNYLLKSEEELVEHLTNATKRCEEYANSINEFKTKNESFFTEWFGGSKSNFDLFDSNSKKRIQDLEKTYQEKLKLEEPAKYWAERAKQLRRQAWILTSIILFLVVITCIFLGNILYKTPEQIYASWLEGDKIAAIRWSIIYITLLSFIVFCLRALTKVMFSSFHLARDCEERHTLTYFYLSLLKDSKVDEKDRQLIMQSLFSRAETGLLKDDSSPTMPNDVISRFLGK